MNTERLPERCFSTQPSTGELIVIYRGEEGYHPVDHRIPDLPSEGTARILNHALGVTDIQVEAMVTGSMFGWDVPGADPDVLQKIKKET